MRHNKTGFTLLEISIAIAMLAILAAIARPLYTNYRTRSMQSDAKLELTDIFTTIATFKEEYRTYHMNFPDMGYATRYVSQTDMSSTSNPFYQRLYAVSAGGPLDPAVDEAKPVTFASLGVSVTRPDPKNYAGWLAPNSASCNISAAQAYGATGGATPTATSTTLLITAKGCPKRALSGNFDVITIDQDGIIRQIFDATNQ